MEEQQILYDISCIWVLSNILYRTFQICLDAYFPSCLSFGDIHVCDNQCSVQIILSIFGVISYSFKVSRSVIMSIVTVMQTQVESQTLFIVL